MFTKRIIPCLDCKDGRVVKGTNFVDLKDAGDPVEIAKAYDAAGADELVFLDITASCEERDTVVDMVRAVAANVFIPFTVGGGIRTVDDFRKLLREGADKISVNSAAIDRPELIHEAAEKFGSQCVVVAIDASVGSPDHVGFATLGKGALQPGLGVSKELMEVGDISITGIVGGPGSHDPVMLQSVRLSMVMKMADCICESIALVERFWENTAII